jgi:hypothetical protein
MTEIEREREGEGESGRAMSSECFNHGAGVCSALLLGSISLQRLKFHQMTDRETQKQTHSTKLQMEVDTKNKREKPECRKRRNETDDYTHERHEWVTWGSSITALVAGKSTSQLREAVVRDMETKLIESKLCFRTRNWGKNISGTQIKKLSQLRFHKGNWKLQMWGAEMKGR